ncbi:2-dehydro-3-deoxygalactonokinase [Pseudorhodoferax sp. Leaf265]|uniref:2-dehydro-3-deoxygalactonokinase n=1 Tax=Pseudorhodoferax sp. Leaf265 TaxID=1736315 RepID=UPI0006FECC89|nr:2-dehydro-3-deoxygalactonokinase [Pseudorhodoferax sp. Leaf265]KQP19101.1 2-dehydro-3-deoxygalactonokinase [Pseudorhodoferax sp. Leaf265]
MPSPSSPLLAIDWGTSSLRGARIAADGQVLEQRGLARGILSVPGGGFEAVLDECFGDWRAQSARCLVSGMAGSRQGWLEAPYCPCPAGFAELAAQLAWVPGARSPVAIVPGLSMDQGGLPDVMRGEEVQIFGAMRLSGQADGLFVLPGTHSKWARAEAGRVTGFRSFMTGEVYALLSQHSILARTLNAEAPFDEAAFVQGVARARDAGGLLHHAFGARALTLFGQLDADRMASYLSGLVIGAELHGAAPRSDASVVLIGSELLAARYALALEVHGVASRRLGAEATWAGLHALARILD